MYLCPSLKRVLLYLCIGCWGLCACDKYENDRDVFFIQFDSASVKSDLNNAKGDYKITDLWIYNNYQFIGVYPLGSKVTVTFVTQPSTLTLLAGIKQNGISDTRTSYIMLNPIDIDTFAALGETLQLPLEFSYKSSCTYTWTETFDGLGSTLRRADRSDVGYRLDPAGFEGNGLNCLLDSNATVAQLESSAFFNLPLNTSNVYLELQYQCSSELQIGLVNPSGFEKEIMRLYPKTGWNKIYIALGTTINAEPKGSTYKVYFRMLKNSENPPVWFKLDNLKLVFIS